MTGIRGFALMVKRVIVEKRISEKGLHSNTPKIPQALIFIGVQMPLNAFECRRL
jgi:hypothetical protein